MKHRSLIALSTFIFAAFILVAIIPNEATSTEPAFFEDAELFNEGLLQLKEDPYGNAGCSGRCGGSPCCPTNILM
jgi:hypothetical protein